ncbi:hypothetical protein NDU88_001881 [Pleurodeles waltl]|uniref:Uncharacterized protein n=1 Tax=Pleurodeles waltl TaxID=8319 RepID=A0AAV7MMY9_PLEWA|nr:hypothetical protein NDU88_001881 [Pleurodeles waltl]
MSFRFRFGTACRRATQERAPLVEFSPGRGISLKVEQPQPTPQPTAGELRRAVPGCACFRLPGTRALRGGTRAPLSSSTQEGALPQAQGTRTCPPS